MALVWLIPLLIPNMAHGQVTKVIPTLEDAQQVTLVAPPDNTVVDLLTTDWEKQQKAKTVLKAKSALYSACSCVSYARWLSGINVPIPKRGGNKIGWAIDHPVNSQIPKVGGIAILNIGAYGHLVVVVAINDGFMTIKESNYSRCGLTTRVIPINDPAIVGYYNL